MIWFLVYQFVVQGVPQGVLKIVKLNVVKQIKKFSMRFFMLEYS